MKKPVLQWLLLLVSVSSCSTDTGPQSAGLPAKLSFSQQPTNAVKDTAFVSPIKVQLLDQNGSLVTTATDNVTLALGVNPKNAHVTGTLTVAAAGGVATFAGLKLDSVGTGYRLVATSGALPADTSAAFAVTLSLKDVDGDGLTPNAGDCNDADSAVHPGAVDFPDPNLVDANCDGLDGDRSLAVFVRFTGDDSLGCGTEGQPCKTIQTGIARAVTGGKRDVYVGAGAYSAFTMASGVNVFGGFDDTFGRLVPSAVTVVGKLQAVAGMPDSAEVAVLASGLTQSTILADVRLAAGGASGTDTSGAGRNSYVVLAQNITGTELIVARSHLVLGVGSDGGPGAAGVDADSLTADSAMNGGAGDPAKDSSVTCDATLRGFGGSTGTPEGVSAGGSRSGGNGGNGGTMDTGCNPITPDFNATPGVVGAPAARVDSTHGLGGAGGTGTSQCGPAGDGEAGLVTNGAGGTGGTGAGSIVSGAWRGGRGGDGQLGDNGGGGGGGGGSGGCDIGVDSWGAGGGGGGAGGAQAKKGGGGGGPGGGSFGIYVVNATVIVTDDSIVGGQGGKGGDGGVGGQGQSGGAGGGGGAKAADGFGGGRGGDGGHGGHGGGGGGGAGGVVYGIYVAVPGSVLPNNANVILLGTGGAGGSGGLSAPGAPVAERDGKAGGSGAAGVAGSCSAPSGC